MGTILANKGRFESVVRVTTQKWWRVQTIPMIAVYLSLSRTLVFQHILLSSFNILRFCVNWDRNCQNELLEECLC